MKVLDGPMNIELEPGDLRILCEMACGQRSERGIDLVGEICHHMVFDDLEAAKTGKISDGYHTFGELYEHRFNLWIALCRTIARLETTIVWRSKLHSDGTNYEGWFVLGIGCSEGSQITYHLPLSKWEECNFAETFERSYFDGHTSADVLERLKTL
jgi:hypothetical protein